MKQIKTDNDPFWFDDLIVMAVRKDTLKTVAEITGGRVEGDLVTVRGNHGELVIRNGDYVGIDPKGMWHIVRLNVTSDPEELRKRAENIVLRPTYRKPRKVVKINK